MALLIKTMQEEASRLSGILQPFLQGGDRAQTTKVLTADDLDRTKAEQADDARLKKQLTDEDLVTLAALSQELHEDNRIRRDMPIVTAGHKRLLLSALTVAYHRMNELTYQANKKAAVTA